MSELKRGRLFFAGRICSWQMPLRRKLFLLFAIVFCTTGCEPTNYNDCILENMQEVSSDLAAKEIVYACEQKFPKAVR
jgi:hypothetical protein